jgi:hypothetical protein
MVFSITSLYSLTGDGTKTLNALTNTVATGSSDISSLSAVNYVKPTDTTPNAANQLIFRNQSLSWWVASLNSGLVKYTPVSNYVNWSYFSPNGSQIHIGIDVSNLVIPNKSSGVTRNASSMTTIVGFEPKFGIGRVDTHSM